MSLGNIIIWQDASLVFSCVQLLPDIYETCIIGLYHQCYCPGTLDIVNMCNAGDIGTLFFYVMENNLKKNIVQNALVATNEFSQCFKKYKSACIFINKHLHLYISSWLKQDSQNLYVLKYAGIYLTKLNTSSEGL